MEMVVLLILHALWIIPTMVILSNLFVIVWFHIFGDSESSVDILYDSLNLEEVAQILITVLVYIYTLLFIISYLFGEDWFSFMFMI